MASRSISTACSSGRRASSGSVIAPRPGPISTMRSRGLRARSRRRCAAITPGSCRKCWPKRLRATCFGDDAAASSQRHVRWPRPGCSASACAGAGERQRGAVIDRSAHDGQAERHVHGVAEAGVLDHRQALVVEHREHCIGLLQHVRREGGVGGRGADQLHASLAQCVRSAGAMTSISSRPRWPDSPACGFKSADEDARRGNFEARAQIVIDDAHDAAAAARR